MTVPSTEKWITEASSDEATTDVAVRTVESRLAVVLHCLPLAAEGRGEQVDTVHQLRVWSRRAAVAMGLYQKWIPRRRRRWLVKQLKRIRRAANDARDCDVLILRLSARQPGRGEQSGRWLAAARAERDEAQKAIVAVHDRLARRQRLTRRVEKLAKRMRSRAKNRARLSESRFGDWAARRLRWFVDRFMAAIPASDIAAPALHRFRIRAKELRYAIELLAGAFPESLRRDVYPTIEAIQDRLGQINDLATSVAHLRNKAACARTAKEKKAWRELLTAEQRQLKSTRREFWNWWSPEFLQKLQTDLEIMVNGASCVPIAAEPASQEISGVA
jgi:CHAD domain-containing protein